ncbi:MAG: DUF177 domain-containing protein [Pseudomonadota bacterium]
MEIFVDDIPEEGLDIHASDADKWLGAIIHDVAGEAFEPGDSARLDVAISKVERNAMISGSLALKSHPRCDRCLARYAESSSIPIRSTLAPLYESRKQQEHEEGAEVELVREDLEFEFYEGDRFDLDDIVREQMLLSKPMKHLCKKDCRGLCQQCGKNLNEGPCGCPEKKADPRWAKLKDIKVS